MRTSINFWIYKKKYEYPKHHQKGDVPLKDNGSESTAKKYIYKIRNYFMSLLSFPILLTLFIGDVAEMRWEWFPVYGIPQKYLQGISLM